jgi:hypothetical protein
VGAQVSKLGLPIVLLAAMMVRRMRMPADEFAK